MHMYFDIAKTVVQNDSKKVPVPCGSGGDRQSLIQLWTRINKSSLIELSSYLSEVMSDTNSYGYGYSRFNWRNDNLRSKQRTY